MIGKTCESKQIAEPVLAVVAQASCEGGNVSGAAPVGSVFNGVSVGFEGETSEALL
jgi:hypothetical protein